MLGQEDGLNYLAFSKIIQKIGVPWRPVCARRWPHRGPFIAAPWALLSTLEQSQLPPPSSFSSLSSLSSSFSSNSAESCPHSRTTASAEFGREIQQESREHIRPSEVWALGPLGLRRCQGRTRTMTSALLLGGDKGGRTTPPLQI